MQPQSCCLGLVYRAVVAWAVRLFIGVLLPMKKPLRRCGGIAVLVREYVTKLHGCHSRHPGVSLPFCDLADVAPSVAAFDAGRLVAVCPGVDGGGAVSELVSDVCGGEPVVVV